MKLLKTAVLLFAVLTVLTGVIYPLVVTGIAQLAFPRQAQGDSDLIGQSFTGSGYFWSRPSATAPYPYNGAASSGSNLGPTNPVLLERVKADVERIAAAHPGPHLPGPPLPASRPPAGRGGRLLVPVDMVTTSASGLDPNITPAAAYYQVERVAAERGLDPAAVRKLVDDQVEGRTFGLLGEPRVNVVRLNRGLDALR